MSGLSIVGVDDGRPYHFDPLPRSLGLEVVGFFLVCHCKDFSIDHHRRVLFQLYLSLLLPGIGLVVDQLRRRVKNESPLCEVAEEHLLLYYP